jgi:hypothetical protein
MLSRLQTEEYEPVPARPGHALRHCAQGSELSALVLKSIHQYSQFDVLASEPTLQHHTGERQPTVTTGIRESNGSHFRGLGCGQAEIPVVGNFQGASVRPFRQSTLEVGLQPPAYPAPEEDSVPGAGSFREEFLITRHQHRHGCGSQALGLFGPGG